jgi:hypothetical protein
MKSPEEIVREAVDAFNSGDMARTVKLAHPEMILRQPLPDVGLTSHRSFMGSYRGPGEIEAVLNEMVETLNGVQLELRRTEEVGDDALLYEVLVLIGPETERSAQIGWYLSHFRDGLFLSTTAYGTEAAAREAIERGA